MGDHALLALRVPKKWGGSQLDKIAFHRFQILAARYSGALAFLQSQHQSAASQLAVSGNEWLKQTYLPSMGKGKILLGVGFSQLRRQGKPLIKAIPVAGGYVLEGKVPWITGFAMLQEFIIGATLATGEELYGIVPLRQTQQKSAGRIDFSQPLELAAMSSTNTVSASLNDWFLECDRVLAIKPKNNIHKNDQKNVLEHSFFPLGCAQAGLDILQRTYEKTPLPFLDNAFNALNQELIDCRQSLFDAVLAENSAFEHKLKLRVWAINLAGRCSQAAVTASSGAANSLSHPAQRVYREALLFSISGQTTAVMEATLRQLLSDPI